MILYAFLSLLVAILAPGLGFFVYLKTSGSKLSRVFLFFTLGVGILGLSQYQMRITDDFNNALLWSKAFAIWPFVLSLALHFVLALNTQKSRSIFFYIALYIPGIILMYIQFNTNWIALPPIEKSWGWSIRYNYGLMHTIAAIFGIGYWLTSLLILHTYYRNFKGVAKKQALLIFIGYLFSFIITLVTDLIQPYLNSNIPELGSAANLLPLSLIGYAIWKYQLFFLPENNVSAKLFDSISGYLLVTNHDHKIIEINPHFLNKLGYTRQEVIGKELNTFLEKESNPITKFITQSNEFKNKEIRFISRKKTSVSLNFSASYIKLTNYSLPGLIYIGNEIKKHSNEAFLLDQCIDRINFLAESAMDLVRLNSKEEIHTYVTNKVYSLLNKEAVVCFAEYYMHENTQHWKIRTIQGVPQKDLVHISSFIGINLEELGGDVASESAFPFAEAKVDELPLNISLLTNGIISEEQGKKITKQLKLRELYLIPIKHGNLPYGLLTIFLKEKAPPFNQELIKPFMALVSLLMHKQYAETEMAKSEKLFKAIVESSQFAIFLIDNNWKLLLAEGKNLDKFGINDTNTIGHSTFDMYCKNKQMLKQLKRALNGETFKAIIRLRDNTFYNIHFTPFKDENGNILGTICMADDISVQIAAKKRLTDLNEMKTKLFSVIGHDIKSPIASIMSFTDMMLNDFDDFEPAEIKQLIKKIQDTAGNGHQILTEILEWSQSVLADAQMRKELISLKIKADKAIAQVHALSLKKHVELTNRINESAIIMADRNMITTVFRNIITNAIKFTNTNGKVVIESYPEGDSTCITISDNGIGMSEKKLNSLFYFVPEQKSKGTDGEPGMGFGLQICKDFVEKNGGEISIESELGKGSTVKLTFPTPGSALEEP